MAVDQAFTRSTLKGTEFESVFAGAQSFLRRKYTKEVALADVVVAGIPFDLATTNRPGARLGPNAIRRASTQLAELDSFTTGDNIFKKLAVVDYGDLCLQNADPESISRDIAKQTSDIIQHNVTFVGLGGDHFISYGLLKAHYEKYGPLALVQFDAHPDTWSEENGPIDHGVMFGKAADEAIICTENSIQIGIRTFSHHNRGIKQISAEECHDMRASQIAKNIKKTVGTQPCYLTFDIDCLDPAFAPGTGTPVCGGLTTAQAMAIIRQLQGLNIVGVDLVEVSPPFDHAEITALAAATIIYEILCLLSIQK